MGRNVNYSQQLSEPSRRTSIASNTSQIGPFAKLLCDSTDLIHHRTHEYSATPALSKNSSLDSSAIGPKVQPPRHSYPSESGHSKESVLSTSAPESFPAPLPQAKNEGMSEKAQNVSSQIPIIEKSKPAPVVLVPPLSEDSRSNHYITFGVDESCKKDGQSSSRKRKRDNEASALPAVVQSTDQRAISDETLSSFLELVHDVFETSDILNIDRPGSLPTAAAQHFVSFCFEEQEFHILSSTTQAKIDSLLVQLDSTGRMSDVPADCLSRLQNLCDSVLLFIESSNFTLESSFSENDSSSWFQRIGVAEAGLRSARTAVRIMTYGRDEKQLYSEELLQRIFSVLSKVLRSCIITVVEARPKEPNSDLFDLLTSHRKGISQLLYQASKVTGLLVEILEKIEMADHIITTAEFFAIKTLFVEYAQSEKDSVLGTHKFENLRRAAMDMITQIFRKYPDQRTFLFDEILSSLQKLPTKGQHARQYKLPDGTNIQLVCALILRLVQTSATRHLSSLAKEQSVFASKKSDDTSDQSDNNVQDFNEEESEDDSCNNTSASNENQETSLQRLAKEANNLNNQAAKQAQYVVRYFVGRAMSTSKSGDEPHRHLLDMLVEDLVSVLGNPEWPAAELMLRALLVNTINITEKKSSAPAKNMALELLGIMGSAISELVASAQQSARSFDDQDSALTGYLRQTFDEYLDGSLDTAELLRWDGPYRAVIEYLSSIDSDSLPTHSAQGYYVTQWARAVSLSQLPDNSSSVKLVDSLRKAIATSKLPSSDEMESVSKTQARLAYSLTVLSMDFCRQFDLVFKILLDSITSEQTTVRTRSLKSVTQMLEKDPSLLDRARNVKGLLMKCSLDTSPSVRDSALMLIGKCIVLKPALEQDFLKHILALANDTTTGVRKRALKSLKDIYSRNSQKDVRSVIADCLCQRTKDAEKSVSELASQMLEDSWLSPFWNMTEASELTVQEKLGLQSQLSLIVETVQRGESAASVIVSFLKESLLAQAKNSTANFRVCQSLVASAFENIIDPESLLEKFEQRHILQTLTVFAKADARLFSPEQLQYLQPYITNLSNSDDLNVFRAVVVIFRCVLPAFSTVQHSLLRDVQTALFHSVSKLGRAELNEVAACLWTINGTLRNPEKLVKLVVSVIRNLYALMKNNLSDQSQKENLKRIKKYIQIAGYFGKHCDFEEYVAEFQEALSWWRGSSVSGLLVSSMKPFASRKQPLLLRVDALNGIGLICQAWPHHYNQTDIGNTFQEVLDEDNQDIQVIVLTSFKEFFALQERQAEIRGDQSDGNATGIPSSKLGGSMTASESDGASALIAQRFLRSILHIALATQDACAVTATEVIASINRQGLVHPKESGPALVALETSTNPAIADVAEQAHRDVHQQHESMFEREYMRAVHEAYRYQTDVVKDPLGYTTPAHASKLHAMFEIVKTSKGKYQKKFISNFCSKIDSDIEKLDLAGDPPASVQYSRFLVENLAFFEYGRVDELIHALSCMEKIVADSGSQLSHNINTEVFHVKVDAILGPDAGPIMYGEGLWETNIHEITPWRLRQLATGSVILSCLWDARTYLRRLHGLNSSQQRRESKGKASLKDVNKAPIKVQGVSSEKFLAGIAEKVESLADGAAMLKQCKAFVDLLAIDNEVKVAAEGEESADGPETPSEDEADTPIPFSGGPKGPGKRKGSGSVGGTPQKKRGRPSLGRRKSSRKSIDSDRDWD